MILFLSKIKNLISCFLRVVESMIFPTGGWGLFVKNLISMFCSLFMLFPTFIKK